MIILISRLQNLHSVNKITIKERNYDMQDPIEARGGRLHVHLKSEKVIKTKEYNLH